MDSALVDRASEQFLGQWRRLVSTTNWEKGQIIHAWRDALAESDALASEFSDEAWSRRVGNVTPQHVGRLRRVFERFATVREQYQGLYWSHFQAALDWDDAELWLEGAVQSDWSIADMRRQRIEAFGGMAGGESVDDVDAESEPWDEDSEPIGGTDSLTGTTQLVCAPEQSDAEDGLDGDEDGYDRSEFDDESGNSHHEEDAPTASEAIRPFAELPPLPPDVNDAFESYKLCILRHKLAGWQEISRDDMLASLDSLKQLALAPAEC